MCGRVVGWAAVAGAVPATAASCLRFPYSVSPASTCCVTPYSAGPECEGIDDDRYEEISDANEV